MLRVLFVFIEKIKMSCYQGKKNEAVNPEDVPVVENCNKLENVTRNSQI